MPYRIPAEMPPPDPPERRIVPPPSRSEKLNFYATVAWGFCVFIHVLGGIAVYTGKGEFPWHQVGQVAIWTWWAQGTAEKWRKQRRDRLNGV